LLILYKGIYRRGGRKDVFLFCSWVEISSYFTFVLTASLHAIEIVVHSVESGSRRTNCSMYISAHIIIHII